MGEHTPLPWRVQAWSRQEAAIVATCEGRDRHVGGYLMNADAALCVRAVNAHHELLKALTNALAAGLPDTVADAARAAIAKATQP
ncbi:hypothetical protein [Sphingomonas baiyangensis]|uniref:Uncharacterized protein n=1 Tax=Sphingomonas baiyangensis TaxID=2572576 RepID=A0A4U1L0C5_9SPHN|nr:hypothetical protein [Sphingomonas baiyangensis]TKD50191.1 hypothetical protein FBR43_05055 [Sphingomonas baiyangensis]